jgi:hypothetical protein
VRRARVIQEVIESDPAVEALVVDLQRAAREYGALRATAELLAIRGMPKHLVSATRAAIQDCIEAHGLSPEWEAAWHSLHRDADAALPTRRR